MTVQARNRSQAEDNLRLDQRASERQSTIENVESNMSEPHPCQQLTRMITGSWTSRAIYVAAKLRIADPLAASPRAAEELAAAAGVAPRPLYRVLRALAGVGVFAQQADGRFRLNPLAEPLCEGGPDSFGRSRSCWGRSSIASGATCSRPSAPASRPSSAFTAGRSSPT